MPVTYGLVESADLPLGHLPPQLDGLRIAHLSDLHIHRRARLYDRLTNQLSGVRLDLVVFTGDYIREKIHEQVGLEVLDRICAKLRPRLGMFGVFGNHDTQGLWDAVQVLPIRWLCNESHRLCDSPIEVFGIDGSKHRGPDSIAMALGMDGHNNHPRLDCRQNAATNGGCDRPLRIMLCHYPRHITTAADLEIDLVFAGHTHGGQCRLPTGHVLINGSDLPRRLTSGILRHRNTLMGISRGAGRGPFLPRLFCPPQVPVYTLRKQTMPGRYTGEIEMIQNW